MSQEAELLSDIDVSDEAPRPSTPTKRSPNKSIDENPDSDAKKTEKHKEGEQANKILTDLFGADEEEESSDDAWSVKARADAANNKKAAKETGSRKDEPSGDKDANKAEDGEQDDGFIVGDREESSREEPVEVKLVQLPLLRLNRGPIDTFPVDSSRIVLAKPPSTLGAQPTPFDDTHWDGSDMRPEMERDDKRGGRLKVKRRIHDMIRWRMNAFGGKESNSKFVEFDDGTIVLYIGDEAYEVDSSKLKDSHHLFAQQVDDADTEAPRTFLECDTPIKERFTLYRSNVFDVAQKNFQVRMKTLQKNKSTSKIVQHSVADPLADKEEKEKTEAAQAKLAAYGRRSLASEPVLTEEFLENADDTFDIPKSRFGGVAEEEEKASRLRNAKRLRDDDIVISAGKESEESEEDDEEGGLLDEDDEALFEDEDEDERPSKKSKK